MRAKQTVAAVLIAAMWQCAAAATPPSGDGATARNAFLQLQSLAGTWEGTAGPDKQLASIVYRVASGGTVVLETQFPETNHEMITMYHMDGDALVATHYCSQGNQPRFRFDSAASTPTRLVFAFAGGTNLDPARDGHVHGGELVLSGRDALQARWDFWSDGKMQMPLAFELQRKR